MQLVAEAKKPRPDKVPGTTAAERAAMKKVKAAGKGGGGGTGGGQRKGEDEEEGEEEEGSFPRGARAIPKPERSAPSTPNKAGASKGNADKASTAAPEHECDEVSLQLNVARAAALLGEWKTCRKSLQLLDKALAAPVSTPGLPTVLAAAAAAADEKGEAGAKSRKGQKRALDGGEKDDDDAGFVRGTVGGKRGNTRNQASASRVASNDVYRTHRRDVAMQEGKVLGEFSDGHCKQAEDKEAGVPAIHTYPDLRPQFLRTLIFSLGASEVMVGEGASGVVQGQGGGGGKAKKRAKVKGADGGAAAESTKDGASKAADKEGGSGEGVGVSAALSAKLCDALVTALGLSEFAKLSMKRQNGKDGAGSGGGGGKGSGKVDINVFLSDFGDAMRRQFDAQGPRRPRALRTGAPLSCAPTAWPRPSRVRCSAARPTLRW